ncbi:hypothetical protein PVL29_025094 [Vitis rotundifolia]|uniref:Uncharacterized protein n=1 Tax=Vitis rotundifolia TaxID=103349 RepID=A0AA39D931_VITRO|nr:hypothetical protein PVL29_025094 [Vitis rotundifolia]
MCWKHLVFPDINPSDMGRQIPIRLLMECTSLVKLVVDRSSGCATTLALPKHCSEKALEYAAKIKWKNLEVLPIRRSNNMAEIIPHISLHCKNFAQLIAPGLVTFVPNIRYLFLKVSGIDRENLVILQGCKELVSLDIRDCIGFEDDDAERLQLALHIPAFMCEGSGILILPLTD